MHLYSHFSDLRPEEEIRYFIVKSLGLPEKNDFSLHSDYKKFVDDALNKLIADFPA